MPVPQIGIISSNASIKDVIDALARLQKDLLYMTDNRLDTANMFEAGGWIITPGQLASEDGLVGMSTVDTETDDIRFWSGGLITEMPTFYVTKGGLMVAQNANIKGTIEALAGHIGGFTIALDKLYSDSGTGIIQGGTIRTAETGARIELSSGVLKGYSADNNLNGLVFSPSSTSNFFDIFIYRDGNKLLEFYDNLNNIAIRGGPDSIGMTLGSTSKPTTGVGTWRFTGNATFDNDINGKASEAYFADHAATASAADELSPSGEIAWAQVLKGGSDISDIATRNLSSLTQSSSYRTVTDTEKATWNAKADTVSPAFTGTPTAPNATAGTNTTQIATTSFVATGFASKTLPAWTAPELQNGWVNNGGSYATAGYYKDDLGIVHIKGLIKSGSTAAESTIFNLPIGYRPNQERLFRAIANNGSNDVLARVNIDGSGNVKFETGANSWLSLDGICFRAEQ